MLGVLMCCAAELFQHANEKITRLAIAHLFYAADADAGEDRVILRARVALILLYMYVRFANPQRERFFCTTNFIMRSQWGLYITPPPLSN